MRGLVFYTLTLLLLSSLSGLAQPSVQVPLLNRVTDGLEQLPEIRIAAEHLSWFDTHRYGSAYIDEMDMRIGGITEEDNELAFRIKPTNPFLFAAGRKLGMNMERRAALAYRKAVEDALYRRYASWLEVWFRSSSLKQIEKAAAWREQWSGNMQRLTGNDAFDPEELLDIEIDRINLRIDELKEKDKLADELHSFYRETSAPDQRGSKPKLSDLDVSNLDFPRLSAEKLLALMNELMLDTISGPLELEEVKLDIEQSNIRIEMEKMDWDIGFIQPEWDNKGTENFSMRVGVGIPLFRPNRLQMQNRQLELFEEKSEEAQMRLALEKETMEQYRETEGLVNRLASMENLKLRLSKLQEGIPSIEGKDAREILLKWLKANEKLDRQMLEDQFLLLSSYLEYLKLTGRLSAAANSGYFENIWHTNPN